MTRERSAVVAPASEKPNIALWGLGIALLAALLSRSAAVLTHSWALSDGGLFLAMARGIENNGWKLPAIVHYPIAGHDTLPFSYPPLGFYLALLGTKLGMPLETYFRVAPAVWNLVTVWAFWRLTRVLFKDDRIVAGATLAFACLPMSMVWNVMGGGVTRGVALAFALLFLERLGRLWTNETASKADLCWAAVLLAATMACHLERFHFAIVSMAVFWATLRPRWQSAVQAALIIIGAVVLAAPWWVTCLIHLGAEPFLAAANSGGSAWSRGPITPLSLFSEPMLPWISSFGVVGTILLLKRKQWLFPAWMLLILVFEARSYRIFFVIPFAMAAGCALAACWPKPESRWKMARECLLGLTLVWGLISSTAMAASMTSLARDDLAGMAWARSHTTPKDDFLVLPVNQWASDLPAEWFPALAERRSVSTVQGSEWLRGEFAPRWRRHDELLTLRTWPQIQQWLRAGGLKANYLWVPRRNVAGASYAGLESELAAMPGVELVLKNSAAGIYRLPAPVSPK